MDINRLRDIATKVAKGAWDISQGPLFNPAAAIKSAVYDPIANVADMLDWEERKTPDGQTFYIDPQGKTYTDHQFQSEIAKRTLGMALSSVGANSAPNVAPKPGPGVVAGSGRAGMPQPTATPPNTSPFANWQEFTAAFRNGDPAAVNFRGDLGSIPGAPQMSATGSRPAMPGVTGSRPAVTGVTGSQPAMPGATGSQPAMTSGIIEDDWYAPYNNLADYGPYKTYSKLQDAIRNGDPKALQFVKDSNILKQLPQDIAEGLLQTIEVHYGPISWGTTGSQPAMTGVTNSRPAMTGVTGSQPAMTGVTSSQPAMPTLPPGPPPPGRASLPNTTPPGRGPLPPPGPPPPGRAPLPAGMPPPPPAGAPPAAVKSWFGKLSSNQKKALGVSGVAAAGGAAAYMAMSSAADKARNQQSQATAEQAQAPMSTGEQPAQTQPSGPSSFDEMLDPITLRPITSFKTPAPAAAPAKAKYASRASSVLRAAAGKGAAAAAPAAAAAAAAPTAAGTTDKVPVTTSGKPDYNYYAEMMNAADRNDAYARDLINLKEQARMAAIDAGARGEKFKFVPVKDYMNNRIIFVNAGGNDVVLDMNDPRQGVEYQKLLEKTGVDPATMTDWMHRSSKPMLRYMQPTWTNRDVTPDFGYARRSVEIDESKPATPAPTSTATPEAPKPTAVPPTRPEPQPTSVAAFDETRPAEAMQRQLRRQLDEYKPMMSVAQALTQGTPSPVEEAKRLGWDYETNEPRAPIPMSEEEQGIRRAEEYWRQNPQFKPGVTTYKTKVITRRR